MHVIYILIPVTLLLFHVGLEFGIRHIGVSGKENVLLVLYIFSTSFELTVSIVEVSMDRVNVPIESSSHRRKFLEAVTESLVGRLGVQGGKSHHYLVKGSSVAYQFGWSVGIAQHVLILVYCNLFFCRDRKRVHQHLEHLGVVLSSTLGDRRASVLVPWLGLSRNLSHGNEAIVFDEVNIFTIDLVSGDTLICIVPSHFLNSQLDFTNECRSFFIL